MLQLLPGGGKEDRHQHAAGTAHHHGQTFADQGQQGREIAQRQLLAPQQVFFLRENLKLRLLNARLALLAHDQWVFRNELKQARLWVERYFDPRDKLVQTAQDTLKQLSATEINIALPSLNESLSAIQNIKLGKESR